jgi:hypothetical protein
MLSLLRLHNLFFFNLHCALEPIGFDGFLTKLPAGVSNDVMTFPSQGWICPEICHVNPR